MLNKVVTDALSVNLYSQKLQKLAKSSNYSTPPASGLLELMAMVSLGIIH